MEHSPWIVIVAGPNGAGKSTFYNKVLQEDPLFQNVPFVNLDNKAKDLAGPDGNPEDYLFEAGRMVCNEIEEKIANKENFVYETTASGKTHLRLMDTAKEQGYCLGVIFIGLSDVKLSHLRVQSRVQNGGHNVPSEAIERRFPNIINRLPDMLKRADISAVFDNSSKNPYKLVFFMDAVNIYAAGEYPKWLAGALKGRKTSKNVQILSPGIVSRLKQEQKILAQKIFSRKGGRK